MKLLHFVIGSSSAERIKAIQGPLETRTVIVEYLKSLWLRSLPGHESDETVVEEASFVLCVELLCEFVRHQNFLGIDYFELFFD